MTLPSLLLGLRFRRPALAGVLLFALASSPLGAADPDGAEIIAKVVEAQRVQSEMAFIKMWIEEPGGTVEEMRFLAMYRNDEDNGSGYLIRLIRPRDIQGVTMLSRHTPDGETRQYLLLPSVGKVRELRGEARATPFLGSDFTFEDILREIPGSQTYQRLEDTMIDGAPCYVVQATPKDPAASQYSRRVLYIDKELSNVRRIDYFDPNNELVKFFTAHDYGSPEIYGATTRPRRAIMTDAASGRRTIFTALVGRIDEAIDPAMFTPEFIEGWEEDAVNEFMYPLVFEVFGTPQ